VLSLEPSIQSKAVGSPPLCGRRLPYSSALLRFRPLPTALLRATRELFAYVRYLGQGADESGVQFIRDKSSNNRQPLLD
jgi:hypothetical protein